MKEALAAIQRLCNDCIQSKDNKKCSGIFKGAKCSFFEYRLSNFSPQSPALYSLDTNVSWFCHTCMGIKQKEELTKCETKDCRIQKIAHKYHSRKNGDNKNILPFPISDSDDYVYIPLVHKRENVQVGKIFATEQTHKFKPIKENVTPDQLINNGIIRIANKRPVTEVRDIKRQTSRETSTQDEPRAFKNGDRQKLLWMSDGKCSLCGKDLFQGFHADHITPYSLGGKTEISNGQALCQTCNLSKSNKTDFNTLTDDQTKTESYSHNQYICMVEALKRNGFSIDAAHDIISVCNDYVELSKNDYSQDREIEKRINETIAKCDNPTDAHLEANKQIGKFTSLMLPDELKKKLDIVQSMQGAVK